MLPIILGCFILSYISLIQIIRGAEVHILREYKMKFPLLIFFTLFSVGFAYIVVTTNFIANSGVYTFLLLIGILVFFLVAGLYSQESLKKFEKENGVVLVDDEAFLFKYRDFKVFLKKAFIVLIVWIVVSIIFIPIFKSILLFRPYS